MKRHIALFAGIFALSSLLAAESARADQFVYGFSGGSISGNLLNLTMQDNTFVQAPLALNPATGSSTGFSGWYADAGFNSTAPNDNYIVGNLNGVNYADFLVYDLSGITRAILAGGGVASATEQINTFEEQNVPALVNLWDINTDLGLLDSYPTDAQGNAIFADLSGGRTYGSHLYTDADFGQTLDINLNANFLNDINAVVGSGGTEIGIGHSLPVTITTGVPLPSPLAAGAVLLVIIAAGRKLARRAIA